MSTFTLPYNKSNINFYMIVPNALMYHFFHVYDAVMDVKSKYRILVLISVLESALQLLRARATEGEHEERALSDDYDELKITDNGTFQIQFAKKIHWILFSGYQ